MICWTGGKTGHLASPCWSGAPPGKGKSGKGKSKKGKRKGKGNITKGIQAIEDGTVEGGAADAWGDDSWDYGEAVVGGVDLCSVSHHGSIGRKVRCSVEEELEVAPRGTIARDNSRPGTIARECASVSSPIRDSSFDWVVATIDSGAGISVILTDFLDQFEMRQPPASERGKRMCIASGEEIKNEGLASWRRSRILGSR